MAPSTLWKLRQAVVLFVAIGIAGAVIGLLARATGASTAIVYALAGAVFGLLLAFGSRRILGEQRLPVMKPRIPAFGAEDGDEDVATAEQFAIRPHSPQPYPIAPKPVVVGTCGTATGSSTFGETFKEPLAV
jgi:hypothetical protein